MNPAAAPNPAELSTAQVRALLGTGGAVALLPDHLPVPVRLRTQWWHVPLTSAEPDASSHEASRHEESRHEERYVVAPPGHADAYDRLAARLAAAATAAVMTCSSDFRTRLMAEGVSIPAGRSSRDGRADQVDEDVALWNLLAADPLFELSAMAASHAVGALDPFAVSAARKLIVQARDLPADVADHTAGLGLTEAFPRAVRMVIESAEVGALERTELEPADLRRPLARAIVAQALLLAVEAGQLLIDGAHRDALVSAVVAALGGTDRGLGRVAAKLGLRLALKMGATKPVERRREAITRSTSVSGARTRAMGSDQRFQAAGSYWLIRPPRTDRRRILVPWIGSGTGDSGRGGTQLQRSMRPLPIVVQ